jgi:hypothetical protein
MRPDTTRLSKNNEQINRILRYRYAGLLCAALPVLSMGTAQAQDNSSNLPPVQVDAPKNRAAPKPTATAAPSTARRRTTRANKPPKPGTETVAAPDDGNGPNNNNSGPPLQQVPGLGKTGTKLADIPSSIQIIPREVVTEQGGTLLRESEPLAITPRACRRTWPMPGASTSSHSVTSPDSSSASAPTIATGHGVTPPNVNSVPGFVIGNLLLGWENPNWGVSLNVKNFTNKLYFVAANGAGGFVGEGLGAYLTVKYHQ